VSTEIRFPKIGFSMTEGTLSEWMVSNGATVAEGQPLYSFENDKAIEEVTAPASGRLRIIGSAGQVYKVGDLIGSIE
jgi:pyruvate/2-oxoglutarate dehydrogenase complex dihydrolipoamide acyltransferase (E2) component